MNGFVKPRRQRGVALLATLLVVAVAMVLIASLLDRGLIGQARALQSTRAAQAVAFQNGLELWAARVLRDDLAQDGIDSHADIWARPLPPLSAPEGLVQGRMWDLDGCLNLNGLHPDSGLSQVTRARMERLFSHLRLPPELVDAIADWVDADGVSSRGGGEDAAYAALSPPRRPANAPFVHGSELKAVAGVDHEIYRRLQPHVCARANLAGPVNINTASAEVLMSLDERISPVLAQRLHAAGRARFTSVDEFTAQLAELGIEGLATDGLSVASRYFVAEAEIVLAQVPVRLYSLLERHEGRIRILARSQGQF